MSAATSRHEVPQPLAETGATLKFERADRAALIVFARGGLARLYQPTPRRVLFPLPEQRAPPMATLLTTSGELAGGDRLRLSVKAQDGAPHGGHGRDGEVYRSLGPETAVEVTLTAEERGLARMAAAGDNPLRRRPSRPSRRRRSRPRRAPTGGRDRGLRSRRPRRALHAGAAARGPTRSRGRVGSSGPTATSAAPRCRRGLCRRGSPWHRHLRRRRLGRTPGAVARTPNRRIVRL
jgi:hypothetical protein